MQGPDWLKGPLPIESECDGPVPDECLQEKCYDDNRTAILCATSVLVSITTIIDAKFSTFKRLLRVMSQVFQSVRLLRHCHETGMR